MKKKNIDCRGMLLVFLAAAILIFAHCSPAAAAEAIVLGDERTDEYMPLLDGKRIALFANHSAMVKGEHLLELLLRHGEHVTVLYTPEHGIRGDRAAGETIEDGTDPVTGIPIVSLFSGVSGSAKPSSETMSKFDTLVIDIQDVGLRYYTYYIAVCDLLEECSVHGKKVILLDRPNPNGHYVDGPILDMKLRCHIGRLPIPVVHGLTLGELMNMAIGEGWLNLPQGLDFTVIPCRNYTHQTPYTLPVPPSPNLPNMKAVYLYPSLCPFEGTVVSVGRGTDIPFQCFGHPALKKKYHYSFCPQSVKAAPNPPLLGQVCYGVDLSRKKESDLRKKHMDLSYIVEAYKVFQRQGLGDSFFVKGHVSNLGEVEYFDLFMGQSYVREAIRAGKSAREIRSMWRRDVESFIEKSKPYLLYERKER